MSGAVQVLARVPVIGYVLKVVHEFVKLPVLRADLHREIETLASRVGEQTESVTRVKSAMAAVKESQRAALATLHSGQTDRERFFLATISERLEIIEDRDAAVREQAETLLQRVSDNLAEWV